MCYTLAPLLLTKLCAIVVIDEEREWGSSLPKVCNGLNVCVPPEFTALTPNVMVLGGEAFGG